MKKIFLALLFSLPLSVFAQSTASKNSSISSSNAKQANSQSITFSSPASVTSTTTSNNTQNVINSGTSKSIVEYGGDYKIKNVPSVSGPSLTTSNDTCMGSTSGGANGAGFGISVGSTWTDEHCKRLKMSRELWNKGMKAASLAIDCMDPNVRDALEMTGTKCPQSMTLEERQEAFGAQASATGAVSATPSSAAANSPAPVDRTFRASDLTTASANNLRPADSSNKAYVSQFLAHR